MPHDTDLINIIAVGLGLVLLIGGFTIYYQYQKRSSISLSKRADSLFVAGKYPCDLYDLPTLLHIASTNPWLSVVGVVESEEDPWWYMHDGHHFDTAPIVGQIGQTVAEFGRWEGRDIQIVGSPSMINTTKFRLQAGGVDLSSVHHDPW